MFEETPKAKIEVYIQKALASRDEYKKRYLEEIQTNSDYAQDYKEKLRLKLVETYDGRLRAYVGNAITNVEYAIKTIGKNREEALRQRNQQAYNLQMQNAIHSLELAGGEFTKQELSDIIAPFATDAIAMTTLRAAAIRGGLESEKAIDQIAYQDDPVIPLLEGLKRLLLKLKEAGVDGSEDYFSLEYALQVMVDQLTDDLYAQCGA